MLAGSRAKMDNNPKIGYMATFPIPEELRLGNGIALSDSPDEVAAKIRGARTDSERRLFGAVAVILLLDPQFSIVANSVRPCSWMTVCNRRTVSATVSFSSGSRTSLRDDLNGFCLYSASYSVAQKLN